MPDWMTLYKDEVARADQYRKAADKAIADGNPNGAAVYLGMVKRHLHNAISFLNNMQAVVKKSRSS